MNNRPPFGVEETEPSAPVLSAAHSFKPKASFIIGVSDSEKSDDTGLALLGDNTSSPSPEKGAVKIKASRVEADSPLALSSVTPSSVTPHAAFKAIANARSQAHSNLLKLNPPSRSTTSPHTHISSVVPRTRYSLTDPKDGKLEKDHHMSSDEETLRHSEDSQPTAAKSQQDNSNPQTLDNHELSIVHVLWALLLTFWAALEGTYHLVLSSILEPLSFVKLAALHLFRSLFEVAKLWLLFASQCYKTLRLITKHLSDKGRIQYTQGLTRALRSVIWLITYKTEPQRDEGLAGHSTTD